MKSSRVQSSRLKRLVAVTAGSGLILGGLIMLPLPGPGTPLILLGLAVLGAHYHWAGRCLRALRHAVRRVAKQPHGSFRHKFRRVGPSLAVAGRAVLRMGSTRPVRAPVTDSRPSRPEETELPG